MDVQLNLSIVWYVFVEVVCRGENGAIALGLVHDNYARENQPGWYEGTIGYHGDDGG